MKKLFFAASIASLVLVACGSETTTTEETNTTISPDSTYMMPAPDTTSNGLPGVVQDTQRTTSGIQMPRVTLPVSNTSQAQPSTTSVSVNPEHGKPGHRCDIEVGAPLNSPAGASNAAAPVVTTTPTVTTSAASSTPATGTKPKLNPAHGQPFHDCSIEVGKPLKS